MIVVVLSKDRFLMENLSQLSTKEGLNLLRTGRIERLFNELKKPDRVAILDVSHPELKERGTLRQLINLGKLLENPIICICPNQDEELRKELSSLRPTRVFLRCNLFFEVKEFLKGLSLSPTASLSRASAIISRATKGDSSVSASPRGMSWLKRSID